jgi:hypothetical protein
MIHPDTEQLQLLRSGALAGTRRLTLSCRLTDFPREIFALSDTLEVLDLSGNALSSLPDDLPRLHRLRVLFCANNQFTELPEVLGRCEQLEMVGFKANHIRHVPANALPQRLRWLILTDNEIESLPAGIGLCPRLQKVALAGNRLRELPSAMAACTRLELLRISANQMSALPDWLPRMTRLTWLAFGGNPFCDEREQASLTLDPMAAAPWDSLELQDQIGQGASGVIYKGRRRDDGASVAVKVFKGEVTSDGWPHSEMAAVIHAGSHPDLIPVLARLTDHPTQAQGLVMQLIASEFRTLAGPPSLESCTRDVYASETRFTDPAALLRLAGGIASAVAHLHARGITHGDLYGHNILHAANGDAFLGDFGAASLFDTQQAHQAVALQKIESRAFGCLLEELIERSGALPDPVALTLCTLRDRCLDERPATRPLFSDIEAVLRSL